jgi:hypothetical protein
MNGAIFVVSTETLARTLGLSHEGFQLMGSFLDERGLRLRVAHPDLPFSPDGEPLMVVEAKFELIEEKPAEPPVPASPKVELEDAPKPELKEDSEPEVTNP